MTVAGHRHERIAGEIQQEIGAMLAGELKDPRLAGSGDGDRGARDARSEAGARLRQRDGHAKPSRPRRSRAWPPRRVSSGTN